MYKIKRRYQVVKKQPWVVDLLLKINPKHFALYEAKDDCRKVSWKSIRPYGLYQYDGDVVLSRYPIYEPYSY